MYTASLLRAVRRRPVLWAGAFAFLSACAVGPDFKDPSLETPGNFSELQQIAGGNVHVSNTEEALEAWWQKFNDPELTSLVERAVLSNLDLQLAEARIREARARRSVVRRGLLPSIDANTSYSHTRISENGLPFGSPVGASRNSQMQAMAGGLESPASAGGSAQSPFNLLPEFNLYEIGFDSSWEIDLFGRQSRQIEAAEAQIGAAVETRHDVLLSLISEVARNYTDYRGLQQQHEIANHNLAAQKEMLELTQDQLKNGVATELDVARAEAQVRTTEADIPTIINLERHTVHQLGVLLGKEPGALSEELATAAPIPLPPPEVAAGCPADLVRRRPDIRRAERELAAATAQVGVAQAQLYPSLVLTGAFNFGSATTDTLFDWSSRGFSAGPLLSVPLFRGGALEALVEVRNAQVDQALNRYKQTVLNALKEVEGAIVSLSTEQQRQRALIGAVAAQQKAVELATELYKKGLADFLTVLEAQQRAYAAEAALTVSERTLSLNVIALYKVLGGGWEQVEAAQPQTASFTTTEHSVN
jgi:outer membrane protein, multidrug efflux system